ncbi:hypothetical protein ASPTUDRAFT_375422 [Aspergillus tubingensis CBS 134.48]|uniref:Beta-lactamase-related domain-containing protein n=1 Tax=Aspergillus tubingensis (strain CBS 134.48) TaxID=767770 RepID=A0A1L9NGX1_ASPTC|nr:hypothetical protein ASPTUDRAFT_375422 [Aspergillus tubingensis CBS 134.48]
MLSLVRYLYLFHVNQEIVRRQYILDCRSILSLAPLILQNDFKDATFHLEQREEKNPTFLDPIVEDVEGGSLYTTVNEMLKICQGLPTAQFLRPETIEEMFQPHLENVWSLEKPEDYSLAPRNAIWNAIAHEIPVDFGIGGLLNRARIPQRREVNSLSWSGKPNCYWVGYPLSMSNPLYLTNVPLRIDIKSGVAGIYLSQLLPTGDQSTIELLIEFERWVYSHLDNRDGTAKQKTALRS